MKLKVMNAQQAVSMTMDWHSEFARDKEYILEFTAAQINNFFNA